MTFASRTLAEHVARGALGVSALALALADFGPVRTVVLMVVGLVALRGCPMCWLLGLVQTVVARLSGRSAPSECLDGRCTSRHSVP